MVASAAVSVCVELRTGALARHHTGTTGSPDYQLGRTSFVQIGHTTGRRAVVFAVFTARELRGRQYPDWQVVAVHQRHVVVVQSARPGKRHLCYGYWRHGPGTIALDLVPCIIKL